MKKNYVLIDYENIQVKSLALLKGEQYEVRVFLGPKNTKLPVELVLAMQELGDRAEYIVLETSGANALDFYIAYYLGVLAATDPSGFFHIISKDTGYDPLIKHLKARKVFSARSASIEEMPCFSKAAVSPVDTRQAAGGARTGPTDKRSPVDALIEVAVDDLIRRKAAMPRTPKTLRSTIRAKLGKERPAADIDAVYEALVKRGYVNVLGQKLVYALPAAQPEPGNQPDASFRLVM
ncbi:MAG: PIN domain-containing protein [Deltaproteobacteria bacterium]|nr:PIN domain-containing protein [Deltaproteobacteria bacterium]